MLALSSYSELDNLLRTLDAQQARLFMIDVLARYADQSGYDDIAAPYLATALAYSVGSASKAALADRWASAHTHSVISADKPIYRHLFALCHYACALDACRWCYRASIRALRGQADLDGGSAEQIAASVENEVAQQLAYLHAVRAQGA